MVALTNDNGAIKGLKLFYNSNGVIKDEDNFQPIYNINGEIIRVPVDGLLVNIDNITLSQNKLVNTCRTRQNIFYINNQEQSSYGEISSDLIQNGTSVDTTSKHWNFNEVTNARLDFDEGTFNNGFTIFMTIKQIEKPSVGNYLFWFRDGKHLRVAGGHDNIYNLYVNGASGTLDSAKSYAQTSNSEKTNWFNIALTISGRRGVNFYENGSKINSSVLNFSNLLSTGLNSIHLFGRITDLAGGKYNVKTLRVWNTVLRDEDISNMCKIDKIV